MTGDALALPPVIFNESEQAPSERLMVAVFVVAAWAPAGGDASVRAVNKNLILEKKDKLVLEI